MRTKPGIFSIMLTTLLFISFVFPSALFGLETNNQSDRIYGADRYETSLNIAKIGWSGGAETVILAPGNDNNLVDALTASPLAKSKDAPILLTENDKISAANIDYLKLKTKTVYVVSGVIKSSIIDLLEKMNIEVIALGGNNRFDTATNIAKEMKDVTGVFVTTANSNADALSVASIAAAKGMPILLSNSDQLSAP